MTPRIRPLDIQVPDSALADLRDRIARTRLPETLEDVAWEDGTERGYLEELLAYWKHGFSPAPRRRGFDIKRVGETIAHVMAAFGYDRYGAQGGDWGAMASSYAAFADPTHCVGLHLNMVLAPRPADDDASALSEREAAALAAARRYMREETGYQAIQTTRPQALGYALNDSPAGLAAVEDVRTFFRHIRRTEEVSS